MRAARQLRAARRGVRRGRAPLRGAVRAAGGRSCGSCGSNSEDRRAATCRRGRGSCATRRRRRWRRSCRQNALDRDRAHGQRSGRDDPLPAGCLAGRRALLGMAPCEGRLVRPLLELTREQTGAYCERARPALARGRRATTTTLRARARAPATRPGAARRAPGRRESVLRTAALLREETGVLDGLVREALADCRRATRSRSSGWRGWTRHWRAWWWSASPSRPQGATSRRRAIARRDPRAGATRGPRGGCTWAGTSAR